MMNIPTIEEQTAESSDLVEAQQDQNILVIDVRLKQEFNEGIIQTKSWLNIPHYELRKNFRLAEPDFLKRFGRQKPQPDDNIILYCRDGRRAQDGVMSLFELGYGNVKNYFGGLNKWILEK